VNKKPPTCMACEYGPMAAGALGVWMTFMFRTFNYRTVVYLSSIYLCS
jgi:hypothetical protein